MLLNMRVGSNSNQKVMIHRNTVFINTCQAELPTPRCLKEDVSKRDESCTGAELFHQIRSPTTFAVPTHQGLVKTSANKFFLVKPLPNWSHIDKYLDLAVMAEILVQFLRQTLSSKDNNVLEYLQLLEDGQYDKILTHDLARSLFSKETAASGIESIKKHAVWTEYIKDELRRLQEDQQTEASTTASELFIVGLASLFAFVQSNVTGPPLLFSPAKTLLPNGADYKDTKQHMLDSLTIDGESVYKLTPNIELFCLAKTIFEDAKIYSQVEAARWAHLRILFLHQRLLSEPSPTLQSQIADEMEFLAQQTKSFEKALPDLRPSLLLEVSSIHLYYAEDKKAREELIDATKERHFEFALTGALGKRTKFQQTDMSQLVVLARSQETENGEEATNVAKPVTVDLNDDTLLDSISFAKNTTVNLDIQTENELPETLRNMDPEKQPILSPLDSIILLATASSITNTSPADGITREQTMPYATRIVQGGSTNWQIFTQALLIQSRIEGYKARTVEHGLLQLQALVDQVIADLTQGSDNSEQPTPTTFLPRAKEGESAPANMRLQYVFQLASPTRWELEAELASRWINLGGLKSALEIYERLEMWAEVALCWAGIDREDKARLITRKQLFEATTDTSPDDEDQQWTGPSRQPPPSEAPRLYCILGEIDKDPAMFEMAWEVSNSRYFRAQTALGRYWYAQREYSKAVLAFSKAVKIKQLDHATWFAMGCGLLELEQYPKAAEVFSRAVQLDDQDAESWSNLAVALLHQTDIKPDVEQNQSHPAPQPSSNDPNDDELDEEAPISDPQKRRKDALRALKHAARLKRDNYRIWDNLLTVATSIRPPNYTDIMTAQKRIIDLQGKTDGEKCVDENVLALLVEHVTTSLPAAAANEPGMARMLCQLVDQSIVPLITSSSRLWLLVALLAEWRARPETALTAHEKAWRVVTVQPGWEAGTEKAWLGVVAATEDVVGAYKRFGQMERTEGMGAGSGELVMKDWKFKARSAVRGVLGKAKDAWEGSDGYEKLSALTKSL
jgi:tetratricopeptide (TPR) repeat protein